MPYFLNWLINHISSPCTWQGFYFLHNFLLDLVLKDKSLYDFFSCQGKSVLDMVKTSESLYLNFDKCISFGYFTCLTLKFHNKTVVLPVSHWSITIKWFPLGIDNLVLCGLSILLDPSVYYMECTIIII